ncbi:MAG: hypothetical protein OYH76_00050 [Defluviicoccus sp.]|nr:hypothetical protein [Defluviicoccus sp.]MDE0274253.1 hypothetical protein [Defluviicoccus sp.]
MATGESLAGPERVRKLQTVLHAKAKEEPDWRFHALVDKVWREDFLAEAWRRVRRNGGSAGVDGETRLPMMLVRKPVRRPALLRSSTLMRSALGNRFGPGMTLAADAPTTDGTENPATDISEIVHSQDRKTFKSSTLDPEPLRKFQNLAGTM